MFYTDSISCSRLITVNMKKASNIRWKLKVGLLIMEGIIVRNNYNDWPKARNFYKSIVGGQFKRYLECNTGD